MRTQSKNKPTAFLTTTDHDSTLEFSTLENINKRFDILQTNLNKFGNSIKKIRRDYVLSVKRSHSNTKSNGPRASERTSAIDVNDIMGKTTLNQLRNNKYKVQHTSFKAHSHHQIRHKIHEDNKEDSKKSQPIFTAPIIKKPPLVLYKINRFGSPIKIT